LDTKENKKRVKNCRQELCIINTGHRLCHFASEIVAVRHPLQGTSLGVMVDFSNPASVYDNVRQATAFGLRSVVGVSGVEMDVVGALSTFCDKASTVSNGLHYSTIIIYWCSAFATSSSNGSLSI
jgi:dihydrodipicolinate reductase